MIGFNLKNILPDPNNNKELFNNCKFYLERCDDVIFEISKSMTLPHYKESISLSKCADDLNFVKTCARVYINTGKSKNWLVSNEICINIIHFLKDFKSSNGDIEICKKILIVK